MMPGRVKAWVLATTLMLAAMVAAQAKPRVVSMNMCTDQMVLALADDDQILGLSNLARDPLLSFYRRRAEAMRLLSGTAEDVLPLRPELVVTATLARPYTRGLLAAAGLRVEEFADPSSIGEVKAQIARMGVLLAQEVRAATANAAIDAALAAARTDAPPLPVLPLERRGWVGGPASLLTDVLKATGFRSLGAGVSAFGERLPLETIVMVQPGLLLVNAGTAGSEDQGSALLHHPALRHLVKTPRLVLPDNLLVCAGPMLAEALTLLAQARAQLETAR